MTPQCDIVLLTWNRPDLLRPCVEHVLRYTTVPSRLLIVDNGSTDPAVPAYLAVLRGTATVQVEVLTLPVNRGFSGGMNAGIERSRAPWVCLLSNDVLVASGWLREMIAVASREPDIGLVNPVSLEPPRSTQTPEAFEAFAAQRQPYQGQYVELGMCIGFCVLIKRDVLARLGGLTTEVDEVFFEDEDFSERAQQAGYRCVAAQGAYTHHLGQQTVRRMRTREALFAKNRRWCNQRWGRRVRVAWPRFAAPVPGSEELRQWLTQLIAWARRRTFVYAYCPMPEGCTADALFRSVGLVPHVDIRWIRVPPSLARWAALGGILLRRKKRFDIIVAPERRWARLAAAFGWLHQAPVVPEEDEEMLAKQWQAVSQSAS